MSGRANTQFSVAVHVLTYLAGAAREDADRVVSSDELAASANVNPVYVRRVLGPLRDGGVLRSRSGAQGGWQLARPAGGITLDEVWDLVQGRDAVLAKHGPAPQCPVGQRVAVLLDDIEADLAEAVRARLRERTVDGLVDAAATAPGAAVPGGRDHGASRY